MDTEEKKYIMQEFALADRILKKRYGGAVRDKVKNALYKALDKDDIYKYIESDFDKSASRISERVPAISCTFIIAKALELTFALQYSCEHDNYDYAYVTCIQEEGLPRWYTDSVRTINSICVFIKSSENLKGSRLRDEEVPYWFEALDFYFNSSKLAGKDELLLPNTGGYIYYAGSKTRLFFDSTPDEKRKLEETYVNAARKYSSLSPFEFANVIADAFYASNRHISLSTDGDECMPPGEFAVSSDFTYAMGNAFCVLGDIHPAWRRKYACSTFERSKDEEKRKLETEVTASVNFEMLTSFDKKVLSSLSSGYSLAAIFLGAAEQSSYESIEKIYAYKLFTEKQGYTVGTKNGHPAFVKKQS